jgi:outer membrane protein
LRQAYAGLLPKVYGDLSYSLTYQNINSSENTVYAVGSTDYNSMSYGAKLIQPIFRYSSYISVGQAKSIVSRSELELEKARQDLMLRVAEAYLDVLLSQDKLAAIKAEESSVEQQHLRAKERYERGMAPVTDRYDTEARLAAVSAQRVESENMLKDSYQVLVEICGVPVQELRLLKDDIPYAQPFPASVEHWLEAGFKQNLELLIQKKKAEVAEQEVSLQKSAHYPTLDFQADYTTLDTQGSLFGGGSNTSTYNFIVKLNIPIYEGGLVTSKTREAFNLSQSSQEGVIRLTRATERKTRATFNGVLGSMTRAAAMKKSVDAQKRVVDAKEEGFKAGLYISITVLDAMQDLYRYKREYSQARHDYILNSLRLKHVAGTLNQEELNSVNMWLQD